MKPISSAGARTRRAAWRRKLPLAAAVLVIALIVAGLWPRPLQVEVTRVSRGPLVITVDEEGMTRVKHRYVVSTPVGGQLRRIDWKPGAIVKAGETVLAVLETSGADFLDARTLAQAEARVRAADAARQGAVAQRDRAVAAARMFDADFARMKALDEQKAISPQELDASRMRAETAAHDVHAAEFALKVAEYELQQVRAVLTRGKSGGHTEPMLIKSPVSGRILRVLQESARVVPAGFPLVEIGDPTDLEVQIEVLSRDGVAVQPGARVAFEQWGGTEPLEGRVRLVEPSAFTKISALGVEEQRVYVVADFVGAIETRRNLGDSYRVEARIVTWEKPDVLWVSSGAIFQRTGRWQVFAIEHGRARSRDVSVGRSNGVQTEIVEGLNEGDVLIVYPGDRVADGMRVKPLEIETK